MKERRVSRVSALDMAPWPPKGPSPARGDTSSWWYTTNFEGKDMPVTGSSRATQTSVRTTSDRVNEIVNKRDGRMTQVLTNVLSPDGNTIAVIYMRSDSTGRTTNGSFAAYERIREQ